MCQRRVLLARIEVCEVRQVKFCKWLTTTIEGSQEPLCSLTHSIIQQRRCRRMTMRSRRRCRRMTMRSCSWFCASSSALASCPDVEGEGDTHVERCGGRASFSVCKLYRHCQGMLCFEVGDSIDVLVQVHVASAEVPVRQTFMLNPARDCMCESLSDIAQACCALR
jgi:hypothetical protein